MREEREMQAEFIADQLYYMQNAPNIFPIFKPLSKFLHNLQHYGFIDAECEITTFVLLWGIGGCRTRKRIKWLKDKQLLRYFLTEIGYDNALTREMVALSLFCDKWGKEAKLPKSDNKRLEATGTDYIYLKKILKEFC